MAQGKKYFCCALPYTVSVHHGLMTKEQVMNELTEEDFDPIAWEMEMSALFFGENESSYFKLVDVDKNRTLYKAFYPQDNLDFDANKPFKTTLPKVKGEIRVIGMDIALMKGARNDNSIFTLIRLIPNGTSYQRQLVYMEHMNGEHSEVQAIRLKQLHHDFEADYVVLDTMGNGMSVYDSCVKTLYDKQRDIEYPAWTCYNDKNMADRCLSPDALPIIYSMKVNSAALNHEIATGLREDLKQGKIKLLASEIEAREEFATKKNYQKLSEEEKLKMIVPYMQTNILVNELINLGYVISENGFIKVHEVGTNRKDRYSSFAYANYLCRQIEKDLNKNTKGARLNRFCFFN